MGTRTQLSALLRAVAAIAFAAVMMGAAAPLATTLVDDQVASGEPVPPLADQTAVQQEAAGLAQLQAVGPAAATHEIAMTDPVSVVDLTTPERRAIAMRADVAGSVPESPPAPPLALPEPTTSPEAAVEWFEPREARSMSESSEGLARAQVAAQSDEVLGVTVIASASDAAPEPATLTASMAATPASPTAVPTLVPTPAPTAVPTLVPTPAPTVVPTVVPTPVSTLVPAMVPTPAATLVPMVVATVVPTVPPASATAVPAPPPPPSPSVPTPAPQVVAVAPAATSNHVARGEAMYARIGFDVASIGYSISFHETDPNFLGLTFSGPRSIEIYVRPGSSDAHLSYVIAHEIGHAIDHILNSADDRARWRSVRNIPTDIQWWPSNVRSDMATPAGDFAECFASWSVGSASHSSWGNCAGSYSVMAELARG